MNLVALVPIAIAFIQGQSDSTITDLKDGYSRVATPTYTVDIPKG